MEENRSLKADMSCRLQKEKKVEHKDETYIRLISNGMLCLEGISRSQTTNIDLHLPMKLFLQLIYSVFTSLAGPVNVGFTSFLLIRNTVS